MTSTQKIIIKIAEVRGIINYLKERCDNKEDIYIHELSSNLETIDEILKDIGKDINNYIKNNNTENENNESNFKKGEDYNDTKKYGEQYEDYVKFYFKDILRIPSLTEKKELELLKKIKNGDELAKQKVVESNLKLVVNIAEPYFGGRLGFADLIQEGNIGLIKAIENFDIKKGLKFSEYATQYIKNCIEKAIADEVKKAQEASAKKKIEDEDNEFDFEGWEDDEDHFPTDTKTNSSTDTEDDADDYILGKRRLEEERKMHNAASKNRERERAKNRNLADVERDSHHTYSSDDEEESFGSNQYDGDAFIAGENWDDYRHG